MIQNIPSFIKYFEDIRRRTLHFIEAVPTDKLDWAPAAGEFTFADLIRHITAAEMMFVNAVLLGRWQYAGHTSTLLAQRDTLLADLNNIHTEAMIQLSTLADTALNEDRPSLDGPLVKTWRLLMAMIEHEIHHRSQLAMYLTLIHVPAPHIYGLGVEDVIARATG